MHGGVCFQGFIMIGCTKLLCGTATVAEALGVSARGERIPARLLQFTPGHGPLVVWNVTARCNLRCEHCYLDASPDAHAEELSAEEGRKLIDDLADARCPVLLFSGGEPLLRQDLFELGAYAVGKGLRAVLSTNGTLIDRSVAGRLAEAGFSYVGVSIDGARDTHERFRRKVGSFDAALAGIRHSLAARMNAGVRMTVLRDNLADLDVVFDLVEREGVPRLCIYHLVYSGRARELAEKDLTNEERRGMMEHIIERVLDWEQRKVAVEVLTVDNHADGVFIRQYVSAHRPERLQEVDRLSLMHGGCSAGTKFAAVDERGQVHPCQFWGHVTLGSVRERPFKEIWNDPENEFLQKLKNKSANLTGRRCGPCTHKEICGGCRIRAEVMTGDVWGDDPCCYLTDEEIGGAEGGK